MVKLVYKIVWDIQAKKALKEIYNYIKKESPASAIKVKDEMIKLVKSFKTFPEKFQVDLTIDNKEYRSVPIWNYKITYRVTDNEIRIIDIFHTSRNPDELKKIIK